MLAHNIYCLIQSQIELGIEPLFWGEQSPKAVQAEAVQAVAAVEPTAPAIESPVTYSFYACAGA